MKTPPRMLDDETLAPELRHDLEQVCSIAEPYDVPAGERRLAAALGIALTAAASGELAGASAESIAGGGQHAAAVAPGSFASVAVKLSLGGVVASAVVAGVLAWPARPQSASRARAGSLSPVASAPAPSHAAPAMSELPQAQSDVTANDVGPAAAVDRERESAASAQPSGDLALRREIAQLARIKRLIASQPLQALRLAEAGHRQFPRGMLREEREALAVLALLHVNAGEQAVQRGRAFLARYARSAHREEIERELRRAQERDGDAP